MLKIWVYAASVVAFFRAVRSPARSGAVSSPEPEAPAPGWKGFLADLKAEVKKDQLSIVAGSLAYYALLALIPAMIAVISIYGLAFDASDVERQIADLADTLPEAAQELITEQLSSVVEGNAAGLGIGVAISILAALWSASSGMKALIAATNIVFNEDETRGFLELRGLAVALTFAMILVGGAALGAIVLLPRLLPLGTLGETLVSLAVWPLVVLVMAGGLAVLYRYGPAHTNPSWEWAGVGAGGAAVLWALLTLIFSFYVTTFGSFSATYGALAGVIVLLLWFYLSGFVVLLGAEVNAVHAHRKETAAATA